MRTTAKLFLLVGSAVAAAVPAVPAQAAVTDARISNFSFSPDPVTIHVGETVQWTNADGASHTVTADDGSFTSQSLGSQGTFSHTFDQPGTVAYHCAIHSSMHGTVKVEAATTTTAAAPTTTTTATDPTSTTTAPAPTTATTARPTTTTSPKPAAPATTRATAATTTTVAPAAPSVSATTDPAPLSEAAPPSTQPAAEAASESYGSSGAGIGLVAGAVLIVGAAGAAWWVIRRRRSPG